MNVYDTYTQAIYNWLINNNINGKINQIIDMLLVLEKVLRWCVYLGLFGLLYYVGNKLIARVFR